jgi:energy-converting hydrogenase Eha subunit A
MLHYYVESGKKLVITGHSKGAAVAQAVLLQILLSPLEFDQDKVRKNVTCIVFAPPMLADDSLAAFIKARGWGSLFHSVINQVAGILLFALLRDLYYSAFLYFIIRVISCR